MNLSGKSHFGRKCLRQDFTPCEHGEHIFCRVPVNGWLCRGRTVDQSDSNPKTGRTHCRAAMARSLPDPAEKLGTSLSSSLLNILVDLYLFLSASHFSMRSMYVIQDTSSEPLGTKYISH